MLHPRGKMHCRRCYFPIIIQPKRGDLPDVDGASAAQFPTTPLPEATCADHPEQRALGLCERCGSCLCGPCVRMVEGRLYCAACVPFLGRRFQRRVFKHQRYYWPVLIVLSALFFLWQFAVVLLG